MRGRFFSFVIHAFSARTAPKSESPVFNDHNVAAEPICSKSDLARYARRTFNNPNPCEGFIAHHLPLACFPIQSKLANAEGQMISKNRAPRTMTQAPRISHQAGSLPAKKLQETIIQQSQRQRRLRSKGDKEASVTVLVKEIDCIERIMLREMSLATIRNLSSKLDRYFQEWHQTQNNSVSCLPEYNMIELNVILDQIRLLSLDIAQRAVAWCATNAAMHNTAIHVTVINSLDKKLHAIKFNYLGTNYLLKMNADLDFLDDSPSIQQVLRRTSVCNPFLLPINDGHLEAACIRAVDRVDLEKKCAASPQKEVGIGPGDLLLGCL